MNERGSQTGLMGSEEAQPRGRGEETSERHQQMAHVKTDVLSETCKQYKRQCAMFAMIILQSLHDGHAITHQKRHENEQNSTLQTETQ